MEIPSFLETQILEGKAVLFLGAGASREAKDATGKGAPLGSELGKLLSHKFLGGKFNDRPLDQISELAISESNLGLVQGYIRDLFEPLEATESHKTLAKFRWWGIGTTNYDRVLEKAYGEPGAAQKIRPIIEDTDPIQDWMRDQAAVLYLKLHGCISRVERPECPLILTPDQYVTHRHGRDRIFKILEDWAIERPIVFIGHSLQDPDLRRILLQLTTDLSARTRHFIVAPEIDEAQVRLWAAKKISVLTGTLDEFVSELNRKVPAEKRALLVARPAKKYPFSERIAKADSHFGEHCTDFLIRDVEYVKGITATEPAKPAAFYKGQNPGWGATEQGLDVRRNLADTITADHFLVTGERGGPELILVKAHAGAGKTVMLRRLAWDAAHEYNLFAIFLNSYGVLSAPALQEIISLCKERVFLFVDDAGSRARELAALLSKIGPEGKLLTIIAAERTGEWNITGAQVSTSITASHDLPYLRENEIVSLLGLLEKHDSLGTLKSLTPDERKRELSEIAGRQLLVALHEATFGKRFEEIIEDEYNQIVPSEAQRIYLTICVLNRLDVGVRAGIVSRIHGIEFSEFKEKLFAPLEDIVQTEWDPVIRDYMYKARHPHIADIVFTRVLKKAPERFDHYIRCLKELNISYSTDRTAFRRMIRGKAVLDLFPDHQMGKALFREAEKQAGNEAYYFHQLAIYELNRPDGNLVECERLLLQASKLNAKDPTIRHSISEFYLHCADRARTPLEKEKLLKKAAELSSQLKGVKGTDAPPYHTLIKIGLIRLQDVMRNQSSGDDAVTSILKNVEQDLFEGLQLFPGEPYLLVAEAKLATLLSDSQRAVKALTQAFHANPRNAGVAIRLANLQGDPKEAESILRKALEENRTERSLHHAYGKLMLKLPDASKEQLLYHFQRGYTDGDRHYDARLLHGRQLFITGDFTQAKKVFSVLEKAQVSPETRDRLLYPLSGWSFGEIDKFEASYCFIARDGDREWIFLGRHNVDPDIWKTLERGTRVSFEIAFTFRGPNAINLTLASH